MKILLVADLESRYIWDYFQPEKFKDIDIIISSGDLKAEYLSFLVTMIKAPLFYVPGNHNDKYLKNPPEGCEDIDGKIITYKGIRIMGLGGSMRYNFGNYQYTEREMKKRVFKMGLKLWLNKGVDIFVAHAPLKGIGDGNDLCHTGFKSFYSILDKYEPKYFIHGHQHLSYGYQPERIKKYKTTTIINAYDHYILEY
ncbi:metallophosphoesterase family protein [Clostridium oryzae]|uniref:Calcineurin-like phosphoesterase superfamily domain protein n=1 Tax=Clostridium oryzae TaxID=1450648 RepID=A0A1V4IPA2_9CLOT|nr:metallophosphoesterase [Clostridium oryzae]OPJ61644.1 calcineurin-like phosphoesterase superfamily domain protein [Clostridium oryzae]